MPAIEMYWIGMLQGFQRHFVLNSRKWIEDRIKKKIEWGTFDDFLEIRNEWI